MCTHTLQTNALTKGILKRVRNGFGGIEFILNEKSQETIAVKGIVDEQTEMHN